MWQIKKEIGKQMNSIFKKHKNQTNEANKGYLYMPVLQVLAYAYVTKGLFSSLHTYLLLPTILIAAPS